ncbi:hypothetical protein FF38_11388 [Lucilia cuprina]|uniref:Uncharacterized protein n=1 Tax=Lucilia cuprina TaxID=7375 RepID=A0A0L0C382_LUCCU|nr:hypothetical protein FF38_11388 [Lucilia cuprina]
MATLAFRSNKEVMHKAGWKLDENEEENDSYKILP